MPPASKPAPKRVVIVIYPGVTLLDVAGPAQVFHTANDASTDNETKPDYEVVLASPTGGQIVSDTKISLTSVTLQEASSKPIDTLIVAGGTGIYVLLDEKFLTDWIAARYDQCRRLASTCMGAFLIAETGLLEGKTVTTHWRRVEELQQRHPNVCVQQSPLFTREGKLWSSAGVAAGIDLALAMVDEDHGHGVAMQVAQSLVVFLKRPGGQSQFSDVLLAQKQDRSGAFSDLQAWISNNIQAPLNVEILAKRAGMSPRTFARHYKSRTGVTPAKSIEILRVNKAKQLLEQRNIPIVTVARQTGLFDVQRLRRVFVRNVGVSPHEYRQKFGAKS